eukprot:9478392-Pyramimonas_sp.AAC.1
MTLISRRLREIGFRTLFQTNLEFALENSIGVLEPDAGSKWHYERKKSEVVQHFSTLLPGRYREARRSKAFASSVSSVVTICRSARQVHLFVRCGHAYVDPRSESTAS